MPQNTEPVQTIPMTRIDSVLLAWQVFELTCVRRTLEQAIRRGLGGRDGSWEQAFAATDPVLAGIKRKSRLYRVSVNHLLAARGMANVDGLDEAIAAAHTRLPGDQLVCHVAMSAIYAWLLAVIERERACASGRDDCLDRIQVAIQDHALALYEQQREDWKQTTRHCQAAGIDVAGMHPVPDPFGVNRQPCWRLVPLVIDVADASVSPIHGRYHA